MEYLIRREPTAWRRTLQWVAKKRPARIIWNDPGNPLFIRYFLFRLPGGGQVYLHHYLRRDEDRGVHDHPWGQACSLILAGGYVEKRLDVAERRYFFKTRKPGRVFRMTGDDLHQIVTLPAKSSWSLFWHGPYTKAWGFVRMDGNRLTYTIADTPETSEKGQWWRNTFYGKAINE